jgi:hypothetical protein
MALSRKVKARIFVVCALLVVCTALTVAFLPEILSARWHFLHGNSVQFGAWEIPVPWGWRELKVKDSVVVGRIERETPSDVIVGNLDLPVGTEVEIERWRKRSIQGDTLKPGFRFISENAAQLDGEISSCLTFAGVDHPNGLWIHCIFPVHRLDIQYVGTESHSGILNSIIKGIKASK